MITADVRIAEVVLDCSACAEVFARHGIDFCCKGDRTLRVAADAAGIDVDALIAELDAARTKPNDEAFDPRRRSTASLVAYIVGRYHDRLRESLPFLLELAKKVARVHGDHEPRLRALDTCVASLVERLVPHLDEEEQQLFPQLMSGRPLLAEHERMLHKMEAEHREVGELLASMRELTGGYEPSAGACRSYQTLFSSLAELESEIFRHVHLENHVLAPRFAPR